VGQDAILVITHIIEPAEQAAASVEVGAIEFNPTMMSSRPHPRAW